MFMKQGTFKTRSGRHIPLYKRQPVAKRIGYRYLQCLVIIKGYIHTGLVVRIVFVQQLLVVGRQVGKVVYKDPCAWGAIAVVFGQVQHNATQGYLQVHGRGFWLVLPVYLKAEPVHIKFKRFGIIKDAQDGFYYGHNEEWRVWL